MSKIDILVSMSDPHCGSIHGLRPPYVEMNDGSGLTHGSNHAQAWLWQQYHEKALPFLRGYLKGRRAACLLNGDLIEGVHHGNKEAVSSKWSDHVEIAKAVLLPFRSMFEICFVVRGTECHTGDRETEIAGFLEAEENCAKDEWLFELGGVLHEAKHHMGTTKRTWLESGEYSRVMINGLANRAISGHRAPKMYHRAHRHVGGHMWSHGMGFSVCGGWQFLTRYGHKVVPESLPRPSIQVADFSFGPDRPYLFELEYHVPQPAIWNGGNYE